MKKLLILMLALAIALSFAACGNDSESDKKTSDPTNGTTDGGTTDGNTTEAPTSDSDPAPTEDPSDEDHSGNLNYSEPDPATLDFIDLFMAGKVYMNMALQGVDDVEYYMYDGKIAMEATLPSQGKVRVVALENIVYIVLEDAGIYTTFSELPGEYDISSMFDPKDGDEYAGSDVVDIDGTELAYDAYNSSENYGEYWLYFVKDDRVVALGTRDKDGEVNLHAQILDYSKITEEDVEDMFDTDAIEENYIEAGLGDLLPAEENDEDDLITTKAE